MTEIEKKFRVLAVEFLREQHKSGAPRHEMTSELRFISARALASAELEVCGEDHSMRAAHLRTGTVPRLMPDSTRRLTALNGVG